MVGGMASMAFEPGQLGPITLRNRIIKAATFEGASPKGQVTDALIDYHVKVAAGGAGMCTVAYLAVAPEGRTDRNCIVLGDDVVEGLRRLTDAIHAEGAKASAQLGHAGPVANPKSNRLPRADPLPDVRLAAAAAVGVGRVEPRDARLPRGVHQLEGLLEEPVIGSLLGWLGAHEAVVVATLSQQHAVEGALAPPEDAEAHLRGPV